MSYYIYTQIRYNSKSVIIGMSVLGRRPLHCQERAPLTDWGGSELIIRLQAGSIPARRTKLENKQSYLIFELRA